MKEILETNLSDQPLLEMLDQILNEIACYDKLLYLREQLAAKNPSEQTLATKLFQLYTYANDYQKMSSKAIQLEKSQGNPDYGLHSIEALYLNSQVKGASPFLLNLAVGYLEKQKQAREAQGPLPQYFVQLYVKVYLAKGEYERVIEFLDKNEASFGMLIEKRKLMVKTLMKKGDKLGAVNELIGIIKTNYENVKGDF